MDDVVKYRLCIKAKIWYFRNLQITREDVLEMDHDGDLIPSTSDGRQAVFSRMAKWRADFQRRTFGSKFFSDLIQTHYTNYAHSFEAVVLPYDMMGPIALTDFWMRTFTRDNFRKVYTMFAKVVDLDAALAHDEWSPFLQAVWEVAAKAVFRYKIAPLLGLENYEDHVDNIRPYKEIREAPERFCADRPSVQQIPLM